MFTETSEIDKAERGECFASGCSSEDAKTQARREIIPRVSGPMDQKQAPVAHAEPESDSLGMRSYIWELSFSADCIPLRTG
jgi:hypothetical protein